MEAAADPSALIFSTLEGGSDYTGLYSQVSSFVLPLLPLLSLDSRDPTATAAHPAGKQPGSKAAAAAGRKINTNARETEPDPSELRCLAKKFFPFLSRILKILPSILRTGKDGSGRSFERGEDSIAEIFAIYRLALDCLKCIMPCLDGKPFSFYYHRGRLVCCLESCGWYSEAEEEAYLLLENLKSQIGPGVQTMSTRGKPSERSCQYIAAPLGDFQHDTELSPLIVEVVVSIVSCTFNRKTTDCLPYDRIITLVEEVRPWLRCLNEEKSGIQQATLVNILSKCAVFIARKSTSFYVDLVLRFCMLVLRECLKSPLANQFRKIASKICSSFGPMSETRNLLMLEIFGFCIESVLCDCKAGVVFNISDIFELVSYGIESTTNESTCTRMLKILLEASVHVKEPKITCIMNLYAVGLYFSLGCNEDVIAAYSQPPCSLSFSSLMGNDEGHGFLESVDLLHLKFPAEKGQHLELINVYPTSRPSLCQKQFTRTPCSKNHGQICMLSYFNALEFVCRILGKPGSIMWKPMVLQGNVTELFPGISYIQDVIHEFHKLYFKLTKSVAVSENLLQRLKETRITLLHAVVVRFGVSLGIDGGLQESENCLDDLIKSNWIEPQELKILSSSLYNVGASLYNDKKIKKAYLAFKLCYKALWAHARRISDIGLNELSDSNMVNSALDTIRFSVADACAKSVDILKVAYKCQDSNLEDLMLIFLVDWCVVVDKTRQLFNPSTLVRHWVKIMCKDYESGKRAYIPSYSDLFYRRDLISGFIFEQELSSYREMAVRSPKICQEMQLRIIDVLLNDIYDPNEFPLQRARMLVWKASYLRDVGAGELNSCITCLCEAFSLLDKIFSSSQEHSVPLHHHLTVRLTLRAHILQQDIQNIERGVAFVKVGLLQDSIICYLFLFDNRNARLFFLYVHVEILEELP